MDEAIASAWSNRSSWRSRESVDARPERPLSGLSYPDLARIVAERSAVWGDGRHSSVYRWEESIEHWYGLDSDPQLTAADAQLYAERLWRTYATALSPYFAAPPIITVLYGAARLKGARAECLGHRVLVQKETPRLCRGGSRSLTNPDVHP